MNFLSFSTTYSTQLLSVTLRDPLEQFDVLALPIVGGGLTNLSLLLALNVLIMGV